MQDSDTNPNPAGPDGKTIWEDVDYVETYKVYSGNLVLLLRSNVIAGSWTHRLWKNWCGMASPAVLASAISAATSATEFSRLPRFRRHAIKSKRMHICSSDSCPSTCTIKASNCWPTRRWAVTIGHGVRTVVRRESLALPFK